MSRTSTLAVVTSGGGSEVVRSRGTGVESLAVTDGLYIDAGRFVVTHTNSGMRLPGRWRTVRAARDAVDRFDAAMRETFPRLESAAMLDRVASRTARTGEAATLASMWRVHAMGEPETARDLQAWVTTRMLGHDDTTSTDGEGQ